MALINESANNPCKLEIRLLGGLSITVDGVHCNINFKRSRQIQMLLEYMIASRFVTIPVEQYADVLWGGKGEGKEVDNPQGALKNLVWRCRKILNDALPADVSKDLIVYTGNTYKFNNSLMCVIDTEELERLYKKLTAEELNRTDRMQYMEEVVELYRGEFLPILSGVDWVIIRSTYYNRIYIECVNELLSLYLKNELFDKAIMLSETALKFEQYNEHIHTAYIKALTAINKTDKAIAHYEKVSKIFFRDLGIAVSHELSQIYNEIQRVNKSDEIGIRQVLSEIDEAVSDNGGLYCNYEVLKNIYRIQYHSATRNKKDISVLFVSVRGDLNLQNITKLMEHLQQAIEGCLRATDCFTRYSINQFLIIVPNANVANTEMIKKRISNVCRIYCRKYPFTLSINAVNKVYSADLDLCFPKLG